MTNTKYLIFVFALATSHGRSQTVLPSTDFITARSAANHTLPRYLVYRHFLTWVNQLDRDSKASGESDPYKFAEPFSRANLQHQHLDILRDAAHSFDSDLQQHDARAQSIIDRYRQDAKGALAQGQPLPPAPPEIRDLERERIAILVDRYVKVRTALGPDVTAQLDGYLNYEFTPHIKLRRVTTPGVPVPVTAGN